MHNVRILCIHKIRKLYKTVVLLHNKLLIRKVPIYFTQRPTSPFICLFLLVYLVFFGMQSLLKYFWSYLGIIDKSCQYPEEQIKKMGELGLMGINVPEKYGGSDLDALAYAIGKKIVWIWISPLNAIT